MSQPKHRKDAQVRTEPQLQPAGRHAANRTLERLGAHAPDIKQLFHDAFAANPYRGLR